MQIGVAVVYDLRALVEQLVNDAADHRFVAGDGRGGDYYAVSCIDLYLLMLGECHAVERGHRLALAAGGDNDCLFARQRVHLFEIDHHVFGYLHISEHGCDVQDVLHAAPRYGDLAPVFRRNVDYLLETVHIRGEGGDDYALVAAHEELIEARADLTLGRGIAGLFDVCRIAEQRQHSIVAKLAEARDVHHAALYRRDVDLEVAGVDDCSDRGADGERHGIGDTVVHVYKLDRKRAETEGRADLLGEYLRIVQQIVLLKLQLNERCGERHRVDRHIQLLEDIRHSADMILVSVRDYDSADAGGIGLEIADVRQNHVNAVHILVRKAHAAVNDDYIAAELKDSHVLSYLAKSAQRNDLQFRYHLFFNFSNLSRIYRG